MNKVCLAVFLLFALACAMVTTGCKKTTKEDVEQKSYAAGLAAGYAATLIPKISESDKTNVVAIITIVEKLAPVDGATIADTWTPVIDSSLAKLVEQGKLSPGQDTLIGMAAGLAVKGIDYLFDQHEDWKKDKDLVTAAIHKSCAGFRAGIGIDPSNKDVVELIESLMDKDVFTVCAPLER